MSKPSYSISKAIWEITNACNMNCKHCGSSCGEPFANELSTDIALSLCDQLADFGITGASLTGGEPFVRKDWGNIARRLISRGITTNIITNGWLIDHSVVSQLKDMGINNICVSLDGHQVNHDLLRKHGSFQKVLQSFDLLRQYQISTACITTVNRHNFSDLPHIKQVLVEYGVKRWQIQLAMPMGNLQEHLGWVVSLQDIPKLIEFCHRVKQESQLILYLGDNIGYYSSQGEEDIRCSDLEGQDKNFSFVWKGCHAGKRILGIRADGWITGCLAIRNPKYFEGNVRETSLAEICNRPDAFSWNRQLKQEQLEGFCRECPHGQVCLGGCNAQKEAFCQSIYAENPTCLYWLLRE